jgi:hypothetical protein
VVIRLLNANLLKKNFDLVIVSLLTLALVMYDATFELLAHLLHLGMEVLHLAYEWIELGIEDSAEHLFHTDRHGSQLVTFYFLVSVVVFAGYLFWKALPRMTLFCVEAAQAAWVMRSTQLRLYWQSMTVLHRVALAATVLSVAFLASFFVL